MIQIFFFYASSCHLSSHHWLNHIHKSNEAVPKDAVMNKGTMWSYSGLPTPQTKSFWSTMAPWESSHPLSNRKLSRLPFQVFG